MLIIGGQNEVMSYHDYLLGNTLTSEHRRRGFNPGTGLYLVAVMTTENGIPMSLRPTPSDRLKNLKDIDKWSFLSLCLSVR